jgi:hypothetical protein
MRLAIDIKTQPGYDRPSMPLKPSQIFMHDERTFKPTHIDKLNDRFKEENCDLQLLGRAQWGDITGR